AQWRRADTGRQNPYVIIDGVRGKGRYAGTFLAWTQQTKGWFGEGEIKFFMDGDGKFPTVCGTGTEDYFCGSYGFQAPYTTPLTPLLTRPLFTPPMRTRTRTFTGPFIAGKFWTKYAPKRT